MSANNQFQLAEAFRLAAALVSVHETQLEHAKRFSATFEALLRRAVDTEAFHQTKLKTKLMLARAYHERSIAYARPMTS